MLTTLCCPSSESLYQFDRITISSSSLPSFAAALAASTEGDTNGASAGAKLPGFTVVALNFFATAGTASVMIPKTPSSTCVDDAATSSLPSPYVARSKPLSRTSVASDGRDIIALTFDTTPHKPPSSATSIAAATERRRGST